MILMSAVAGFFQSRPVTTTYDPTRKDLGVSSEARADRRTRFRRPRALNKFFRSGRGSSSR